MNSMHLAFGFAPLPRPSITGNIRMTTGNLDSTKEHPTPVQSAKSYPPPLTQKVQNRPELVGGLPLWLTMGAMTQIQRWADMFNFSFGPNAQGRQALPMDREIEPDMLAQNPDPPVGQALRSIADALEKELTALRCSLSAVKGDLDQAQSEAKSLRKQLSFFKLRNAREEKTKTEKAMSSTASQLHLLLCKEQIRAAAAEKKVADLEERLAAAEMRNALVSGDSVKLSALYISIVVVFIGYLIHQPFGPQVLQQLFSVNH